MARSGPLRADSVIVPPVTERVQPGHDPLKWNTSAAEVTEPPVMVKVTSLVKLKRTPEVRAPVSRRAALEPPNVTAEPAAAPSRSIAAFALPEIATSVNVTVEPAVLTATPFKKFWIVSDCNVV